MKIDETSINIRLLYPSKRIRTDLLDKVVAGPSKKVRAQGGGGLARLPADVQHRPPALRSDWRGGWASGQLRGGEGRPRLRKHSQSTARTTFKTRKYALLLTKLSERAQTHQNTPRRLRWRMRQAALQQALRGHRFPWATVKRFEEFERLIRPSSTLRSTDFAL